jgi:membrane protease YdiL (CAAX protease family)
MSGSAPSSTPNKRKPWGFWATLGCSFIIFGVFLLTQTFVFLVALAAKITLDQTTDSTVLFGNLSSNGFVLAIATLVSSPICISLIALLIKIRKSLSIPDYLALRQPTKRHLVEWGLVAIICNVALDLLKSFIDLPVFPQFMIDVYETAYFFPLFYVAAVIFAPLFEELLFRGFIYQGIRHSSLKIPGAIIIPALLWALIHQQYDWMDKFSIFVFGLVLGVARFRTGSAYVTIAMHATNNLLALFQIAWHLHFQ